MTEPPDTPAHHIRMARIYPQQARHPLRAHHPLRARCMGLARLDGAIRLSLLLWAHDLHQRRLR